MGNFAAVKPRDRFWIDGECFVKTSELTFEDMVGIERYINPIDDGKISLTDPSAAPAASTKKKAAVVDTQQYHQSANPRTDQEPELRQEDSQGFDGVGKVRPNPQEEKVMLILASV